MTWRVEMGDSVPMVAEVLGAQAAWRKLTKAGRDALEAAYPAGPLVAHPNTKRALWRHGFITYDERANGVLTEAGMRTVKWSVKP